MRTPTEKAAILLVALGEELAAGILRAMPIADTKKILGQMARLQHVPNDVVRDVVKDFATILAKAAPERSKPARETALKLLQKSLGEGAAAEFAKNFAPEVPQSFRDIESVDAKGLAQALAKERPSVLAAMLAHVQPLKAGQILAQFDKALQTEIILTMAKLESVEPELLEEMGEMLQAAMALVRKKTQNALGGVQKAASILALMGQEQSQKILDGVGEREVGVGQSLREAMFTFADLGKLDGKAMEMLVRKVPAVKWELALRKAPAGFAERIYAAMSPRAAAQMRDNIATGKPVKVSDIEAVQREILKIADTLIASGEIMDPMAEAI